MADEKQPAPDGLSLVIDYVNTRDREAGRTTSGLRVSWEMAARTRTAGPPGGLGAGRG